MAYYTDHKRRKPITNFFIGRIFPLSFVLIGGTVLFFGLRSLHRANESKNWPSVSGVIVSSEIDRRSGDDGATYHAQVLYDYAVDGVTYSSARVGYGDYGSSNSARARMTVNKYPKGKNVQVHYMPDMPQESVLEAGIQKRTFFLPVFGFIFLTAGTVMWNFIPKMLREQTGQEELENESNTI